MKQTLRFIGFVLGLGSVGIAFANICDFNAPSIKVAVIFGFASIILFYSTKEKRRMR